MTSGAPLIVVEQIPEESLVFWVVYERPADYPDDFVVRRQGATRDGQVVTEARIVGRARSLEEARGLIPPTLFRMPRLLGDAPSIVEAWF